MSDRLTGLFIVALAIAYGYVARSFSPLYSDPLGPSFFPGLVAIPLGLLGLFLVFRPDPDPQWILGRPMVRQIATCVVLLAYVYVMVPLGFVLSTAICGSIMAVLLGARPRQAVLTGLSMGIGFYLLFDTLLHLPMPKGITAGLGGIV